MGILAVLTLVPGPRNLKTPQKLFVLNMFFSVRDGETTIKIKFGFLEGGGGRERKIIPKHFFHGERHDNKLLKVQILLSKKFVVIAQAPIISDDSRAYKSFVRPRGAFVITFTGTSMSLKATPPEFYFFCFLVSIVRMFRIFFLGCIFAVLQWVAACPG